MSAIHEALLRSLAGDGAVVLARDRRAAVASPGPEEARDLSDARRVVEAVTVARAAERATRGDPSDLDRLMDGGAPRSRRATGDAPSACPAVSTSRSRGWRGSSRN